MGTDGAFPRYRVWLVSALLLLSSTSFNGVVGTTQQSYYDLVDYLFTSYKSEVRPTNDDTATSVFISFWLLSVQNLDEKNQILQTSVVFDTSWTDPWLTWTPSSYANISEFRYPQKKLWLPDVVVSNSVQSQSQLGYDTSPVRINHDGVIEWLPSEIIETSCDIDVTYYPFDTQECSVIITTWISDNEQINLNISPNTTDINMESYSPSGTWELVGSGLRSLPDSPLGATQLEYFFKLKRRSTFYVLNMIMPVLILSLTASGVYLLPAEAGEKIGMSMTILLAYAVYLTIISENMPQTSLQISVLSVYLMLLLGFTALSVVFSVVILRMYHKPEDEKVGKKTTAFTRKVRNVLRFKPKSNGSDGQSDSPIITLKDKAPMDTGIIGKETTRLRTTRASQGDVSPSNFKVKVAPYQTPLDRTGKEEEEKITWQVVSATLDFLFFLSGSIFVIVLTFITLLVLVVGGSLQNAN